MTGPRGDSEGRSIPLREIRSPMPRHFTFQCLEVIGFLEGNSKIGLRQAVDQVSIYLEKCHFWNLRSSVTLTFTLDRVEAILVRISGRGLPTHQIRSEWEKLLADVSLSLLAILLQLGLSTCHGREHFHGLSAKK